MAECMAFLGAVLVRDCCSKGESLSANNVLELMFWPPQEIVICFVVIQTLVPIPIISSKIRMSSLNQTMMGV